MVDASYNVLVNTLAPHLRRYLHMDTVTITVLLSYVPTLYKNVSFWTVLSMAGILLAMYAWKHYKKKTVVSKKVYDYSEVVVYDTNRMNKVCGLVNMRKDLFPKNIQMSVYANGFDLEKGVEIAFTYCDVKGRLMADTRTVIEQYTSSNNEPKTAQNDMTCIVLRVESETISAMDCLNEFCDMYDTALKNDTMSVYGMITATSRNVSVYETLSPANIRDVESYKKQMKARYIDTFISKHKNAIWERIQQIEKCPEVYVARGETTSVSYILHGFAGTGKSSLPHRIARATMRNLLRVNVLSYTHSPESFNELMCKGHGKCVPSNTVFVFEEMDALVAEIVRLEEQLKNMAKEIPTKPRNVMTFQDVLTAFEGPYPVDGRIVFANTNNIEIIKKHLPQLIRRGRFNMIEMSYWNAEEFKSFITTRYKREPSEELLEYYRHMKAMSPTEWIDWARDLSYEQFESELHVACRPTTARWGERPASIFPDEQASCSTP